MSFPRDQIHLERLALAVRIGVTEEERAEPQRLTVSLTLTLARSFEAISDRLEETINYSEVGKFVRELAASGGERHLIETLAVEIASAVLARFQSCAAVDVDLRKYVLADTEFVGVRLSRARSST